MSLEKFTASVQQLEKLHPSFSDIHICSGREIGVRVGNDIVKIGESFSMEDVVNFLGDCNRDASRTDQDFALTANDYRWRVNACHNLSGIAIVGRKIPPEIPFIGSLGVPEFLGQVVNRSGGLFIVTGVTGSGKTTTLAAMLELANRTRPVKIITLEDPIEFVYQSKMADIIQREIGTHTPTFLSGIKSMMREDPDIALVGEIRDQETAEAAFELAETGHLVFATLHVDKAREAVDRLIGLFKNDKNSGMRLSTLSSVLIGTLSQKLAPKTTGGRVLVSELMINSPGIRSLIRDGESAKIQTLLETSSKLGMYTLNQNLEKLASEGVISRKTALEFSYDPDNLKV
jgi:twitching motility protein PilT